MQYYLFKFHLISNTMAYKITEGEDVQNCSQDSKKKKK